eukprot:a849778_48.p2 GENE.a849778_48~~a849778_48.p2  ORF type:complete len:112 (-),score=6.30 a849778_48:156-464(-)
MAAANDWESVTSWTRPSSPAWHLSQPESSPRSRRPGYLESPAERSPALTALGRARVHVSTPQPRDSFYHSHGAEESGFPAYGGASSGRVVRILPDASEWGLP